MRVALLLFLALLPYGSVHAQDSVIASVPLESPRWMTTDPNGNVYIITKDNALLRLNDKGENPLTFRNLQQGKLAWVDADNPLNILLLYPNFATILLLDNMLSVKATLALDQLSYSNVTAACLAADGNIWIFDQTAFRIIKIDEQRNVILEGNDLRVETGVALRPSGITQENGRLFLSDPDNGIFIFDDYGNFLKALPYMPARIQVIGSQIIWKDHSRLISYHMRTFQQTHIALPDSTQSARLSRNRLFLLFPDRLEIFYMPAQ